MKLGRFPTLYSDVARFLLVRGPYAWIGFGWEGCVNAAPPLAHFARHDFGEPLELCRETAPGSGVFTRRWSKANVTSTAAAAAAIAARRSTSPASA